MRFLVVVVESLVRYGEPKLTVDAPSPVRIGEIGCITSYVISYSSSARFEVTVLNEIRVAAAVDDDVVDEVGGLHCRISRHGELEGVRSSLGNLGITVEG